jgi:2-hydroxychromene-2-carboxylate isomerase
LAAARALITQAETGSAQQYASADLERARAEYQDADKLRSSDPEKAQRLAQKAGVDAKVAMANAQAEKARQALNEVKAGTSALQSEADRDAAKDSAVPATAPEVTPAPPTASVDAATASPEH